MRLDKIPHEDFEKLSSLIDNNKGSTDVRLVMTVDGDSIELMSEEPRQVQISDHFFEEIHQLFGRTDFIEVNS